MPHAGGAPEPVFAEETELDEKEATRASVLVSPSGPPHEDDGARPRPTRGAASARHQGGGQAPDQRAAHERLQEGAGAPLALGL
eukprot:9473431-Pyramimonas_sp.AAC.1